VDLTPVGRREVVNNGVNNGLEMRKPVQRVWIDVPVDKFQALEEHAGRYLRSPENMLRVLLREWLFGVTRGAVGGKHL
jgi:hypothetical protein